MIIYLTENNYGLIIQAGINNVYVRVGENADEYEVIHAKDLIWHL